MYNKYNDILNESKQNLTEMAEKLSKIIDNLNNLTQPVINHLILCLLFSDNQNINHWKKEVYNFIYKLPKDSRTNKYPKFNTLKKFAIDNWADTLDNNLNVYIDNIVEDENLIKPNNIDNNKLASLILAYFIWLYQNLSEFGIMQRSDVYNYINNLIKEYNTMNNLIETYQKGKKYTLKYITTNGDTNELDFVPEDNMSSPEVTKKLQAEKDDFFKLVESKCLNEDNNDKITTYKVSFYVDDINTAYDDIRPRLEELLKNSGLGSFKEDIEIEEYDRLGESKELLLEAENDTVKSNVGFFIGDPCYVLSDDKYDIWGNKYNYNDGFIEINDYNFIVHGTAYGDGEYFDEQGYSYGVDSGTIAVIPLELIKQDIEGIAEGEFEYGRVILGNEASLDYKDGKFYVVIDNNEEVIIDTDPKEIYDDSEDEYNDEDEEDY